MPVPGDQQRITMRAISAACDRIVDVAKIDIFQSEFESNFSRFSKTIVRSSIYIPHLPFRVEGGKMEWYSVAQVIQHPLY